MARRRIIFTEDRKDHEDDPLDKNANAWSNISIGAVVGFRPVERHAQTAICRMIKDRPRKPNPDPLFVSFASFCSNSLCSLRYTQRSYGSQRWKLFVIFVQLTS